MYAKHVTKSPNGRSAVAKLLRLRDTQYNTTQYHTILHGRSIPAMITIYTDDGPTPRHAVRRPVKRTNATSHAVPPRMIHQLHLLSLPLIPTPHTQLISDDTIFSIMIWNQPIVQYQVPIQPNTRNQSRHPSIVVRCSACFDWC